MAEMTKAVTRATGAGPRVNLVEADELRSHARRHPPGGGRPAREGSAARHLPVAAGLHGEGLRHLPARVRRVAAVEVDAGAGGGGVDGRGRGVADVLGDPRAVDLSASADRE